MKVLFDHPNPFLLAHGGFQIQIEQTKQALEEIGVEVDYLRWWDANQSAPLIHFFGRPSVAYIEFARAKAIRVVMGELLGGLGARPASARTLQRAMIFTSRHLLPTPFTAKLAWDSYGLADAVIALTPYEAELMQEMFGAPSDRIHVVPNGVEKVFLESPRAAPGRWLVCTATITERKRVLELARAALAAQCPLWIIGKAYAEDDSYSAKFRDLCAANTQLLRFEGAIEDRPRLAQVYSEARGFVLLSSMETLSLSALEAAACGCPLLLSDLPWARSFFGEQASFCPVTDRTEITARHLRAFHDGGFVNPPRPQSWSQVAGQLRTIYERLLKTSS